MAVAEYKLYVKPELETGEVGMMIACHAVQPSSIFCPRWPLTVQEKPQGENMYSHPSD